MDLGIGINLFLQSYPWALPLMQLASLLGSVELYLLLMPAIYWCWDTALGFRVSLIMVISYGINDLLKVLWHSPRPYWVSNEVEAWGRESSFSLPSGHAQISMAFLGRIACHFEEKRAFWAALLLSLIIGVSRIYLGVHFLQDVIVGWIAGAMILGAFLLGEKFLAEWLVRQDLKMQILISFFATVALFALFALSRAALDGWQMPDTWMANALAKTGLPIDPQSPKDALQAAGLLLGITAGYAVMQNQGGFSAKGPMHRKLMRYLLGMAGLMATWQGMTAISAAGVFIFFLRAMLAGAWVSLAAPLLFRRLGLVEKVHKA
jgi:membrane-associated phospholipid phosphatase